MTAFEKPGAGDDDYPEFAAKAGRRALEDAGVEYDAVDQVVTSYCYGDSTCGQRAVYEIGLSGVPIYNVNNNCASGSSALFMAKQFVEGGLSECVMTLGFEKMQRGSLGSNFQDRTNPMDKHMMKMMELHEFAPAPPAAQMFGNAGKEHAERYGTKPETFAKIAYKNHKNSTRNPYSQFMDEYSLDQIMKSPQVYGPLTKLQCCPTSDGAASVIVASEDFVKKHGLEGQAVEIVGMSMATDAKDVFESGSMMKIVGFDMSRNAADAAYKAAGVSPSDVNVCELHDCFSANELITYEALRFCPEGKAEDFVQSGANDYGGQVVCQPSGGLISKGHPLGATGLAQCCEISWQLRGEAADRQVKDAKIGMTHNLGLGGAAVVGIYKRPTEWLSKSPKRKVSLATGPPDRQTTARL
ncbi:Non-specific lipid-transfer protein [Hondaea fermentalgiana]|uniref:propanoyl-CoA C-acyltransferase n=1 Tax=Hondaea fermentalgiana TaxID=2315210 RepID=A0A2R5GQK4_9STRA|nr:Non-specific lipid-transfer protein [Hondaea fermentalgiana]|eukprot:GBG33130.1 Non-specific lipid-transfer protein [Hondaea fermentalgiana]